MVRYFHGEFSALGLRTGQGRNRPVGVAKKLEMNMDDLVHRLCQAHSVEVRLRPDRTTTALREHIDRGIVHLRFLGTRGGTELGVHIDRESSELSNANFQDGTGSVKLVGRLTLNYVKVQCVADISLESFSGKGHLES
jgi:hypothetical protein